MNMKFKKIWFISSLILNLIFRYHHALQTPFEIRLPKHLLQTSHTSYTHQPYSYMWISSWTEMHTPPQQNLPVKHIKPRGLDRLLHNISETMSHRERSLGQRWINIAILESGTPFVLSRKQCWVPHSCQHVGEFRDTVWQPLCMAFSSSDCKNL